MKFAVFILSLVFALPAFAGLTCRVDNTITANAKSQRKIALQEAAFFKDPVNAAYISQGTKEYKKCEIDVKETIVDVGFGVAHACSALNWRCISGPSCRVSVKYHCDGKEVSMTGKRKDADSPVEWLKTEVIDPEAEELPGQVFE